MRAPKRWKSKGARAGLYGGWTGTFCLSFVTASCVSRLACDHVLSYWRRILGIFFWAKTLLESFCKVFKRLNLQIWVNGLTTQQNVYQNQPFCIPKNCGHAFPCWRGSLKLLPRRSWMMPFDWLSSCLRFEVMDLCFISNDNHSKKPSPPTSKSEHTPFHTVLC